MKSSANNHIEESVDDLIQRLAGKGKKVKIVNEGDDEENENFE